MEDILYLTWWGITKGIYPYPQALWQEAYYDWFGKVGYEWWFGLPLGYFLAFAFLGLVYFTQVVISKRCVWCGKLVGSILSKEGISLDICTQK